MNELGKLKCEKLLGFVKLCALKRFLHFLYLLDRNEGQHFEALDNVRVADVSPVLVEIVRAGLFGIEPDCALFGLAHFLALGIEKQGDGHCVCVLAELFTDKLCAAEHICPLVVTAELHIAAVLFKEHIKVVGLHYHIVELKECESSFHTLLIALKGEHFVYREARAYLAQNVDIVEVEQPVGIVDYHCFAV